LKKIIILVLVFCSCPQLILSQERIEEPKKYTSHNKGKFYVFWGGNRDNFTKSDIHFSGDNYDFTLNNVEANDKPKGWHIDYLNPARMTIPQTNFKIGYFITDHYNISVGVDHMKYVMAQNQTVNMTGIISENSPFDGTYTNDPTILTEDFLTFEHTDGLNYIHTELSRVDDISKIFKIRNTDKFQINITEGIGAGLLYPKTNAKLLGKERHDDFHVSGYGVSAKVGLNLTFFKYFFLQTEIKGGYIDMSDIRTTNNPSDKASQRFFFLQRIIAFGGIFKI
jgi:hypothetical protein